MKFIFTAGPYAHFMGRVFAFKKATDVTDRATIAALLKHPDFMRVDEEPKNAAPPAPKRPILTLGKRKP